MENIKVAIDIDNVLFINNVVEIVSKELNQKYTSEDVTCWGYDCFYPEFKKRVYEKFSDDAFMCNMKVIYGAQQKITQLYNKGYQLYCLTSRIPKIIQCTKKTIKDTFPEIIDTIFENKLQYMLSNKVKYFIDDNPLFAEESASNGICTYLVSNNTTRYNHDLANNCKKFNGFLKVIPSICEFDI
jgi:5'(3')-deoxyribonucleotidase